MKICVTWILFSVHPLLGKKKNPHFAFFPKDGVNKKNVGVGKEGGLVASLKGWARGPKWVALATCSNLGGQATN